MHYVLALFLPEWFLVKLHNYLSNIIDHCEAKKFDHISQKLWWNQPSDRN